MGFQRPSNTTTTTKPTTAPAATGNAPRGMTGRGAVKPPAGRYSGMRLADPRFPILEPGNGYELEFISTKESRITGRKPWLKIQVKVLKGAEGGAQAGDLRSILKCCSDEAFEMSGPEIKNMMMAALGWSPEQENEFEEKNPEWPSMIDAVHGVPEACKEHGDNPLGGMKAKCDAIPNEQFINCVWYPV